MFEGKKKFDFAVIIIFTYTPVGVCRTQNNKEVKPMPTKHEGQ